MSTEVEIVDCDAFKAAIAAVRDDGDSTTWSVFAHEGGNPNAITHTASGVGGPEEMLDTLKDDENMYCLVRLEETFDMSTTVKFVYIRWTGPNVPFVKRGKYGVVQGDIEKHFNPYHSTLEIDNKAELTEESIRTKLQETSGTKSKVLETEEAKARPERGFTSGTTTKIDTFVQSTPTAKANLGKIGKAGSSFTGMAKSPSTPKKICPEDVEAAILQVRKDDLEQTWCVCTFEDNNPKKKLKLEGCGVGNDGLENIKKLTQEDNFVIGFVRVTDVVDEITTTKFVYIQWVGEGCRPMAKAAFSTLKGAMDEAFKPYHVGISATSASEITPRAISDKVGGASGSKSHVKSTT